MLPFCAYIIKSINYGKYYIGQCANLNERLKRHNAGLNKSTKPYRPWEPIYTKAFPTRAQAMKHEKYLKSIKSRKRLEKIIKDS